MQSEGACVWGWGLHGWWQDVSVVLFPVGLLRWGRKLKKEKKNILCPHMKTLLSPLPTWQTSSLQPWGYVCVFKPEVQVEATATVCSAASLTDMMNCAPVCVCIEADRNCSLSREKAWQSGSSAKRPAASSEGKGEGKWEHEESVVRGLSGRSLWEGRVISVWVMRKWRQRRQATPYDTV